MGLVSGERELFLFFVPVVLFLDLSECSSLLGTAPLPCARRSLRADRAAVVVLLREVSHLDRRNRPDAYRVRHVGAPPVPAVMLLSAGIASGPKSPLALRLNEHHVRWGI